MKRSPKSLAFYPPEYEEADVAAVQALHAGSATPDQQKRALKWIIEGAAATYDFPFRPGSDDRETNIALGRQFVGQQIVKLLKINLSIMRKKS